MTLDMFADRIELAPYRHEWPALALDEMRALRTALAEVPLLDIQHVGSTAVRGMLAKPVLDIQVLVSGPAVFPDMITAIEGLGYEFWRDNPNRAVLFFVKGRPPVGSGRTHHVHVLHDPDKFEDRVLFRDALIGDPALAGEYETLKRGLAEKFPEDREAYTQGKTGFVTDVIRNVRWATA